MKAYQKLLIAVSVLLLPGLLSAQPVISNVVKLMPTADAPSHSCVGIAWDTDSTPDVVQILYGPTTSYGGVDGPYDNKDGCMGGGCTRQYYSCGHVPGTTVHFSPQSKKNGLWSNTSDLPVTFPDAPTIDPAPPDEPAPVAVVAPDFTGYPPATTPTCNNLPAAINSAIDNLMSAGAIIDVTAGSNCFVDFTLLHHHPGSKQFFAANVNIGLNRIDGLTAHGYPNGQRFRFGGDSYNTNGAIPAPLIQAKDYFACNVHPNDFQIGNDAGCNTLVTLSSTGSDGAQYVMAYPPPGFFLQLRSSAPDSALPPPGVQITSEWANSIATLSGTALGIGPANGMFKTGPFTSNIYIGPGIQFDVANPGAAWVGTSDPVPLNYWFDMTQLTSSYWILDRVRFQTGWPKRVWVGMYLNGSDIRIENSDFKDISYGMSTTGGYSCAPSGATMTCTSAGAYAMAGSYFSCTGLPTFSVTLTGGTGAGTGWFDIQSNCVPRVTLQAGVTATCSSCALNVGTQMPRTIAGGSYSGVPLIASLASAASWGFNPNFPDYWIYDFSSRSTSQYVFDGSSAINATYGYGPLLIRNSTFTDGGIIPIHFDESATTADRFFHDVTLDRLRFSWTSTHVYRWNTSANALSDLLRYLMRQQVEFKLCKRCKMKGVEITNNYGDGTTGGWCIEVLSTAGSGPIPNLTLGTSDISIISTSCTRGAAGLSINGNQPGSFQIGLPLRRVRVSNFLSAFNNAYTYSTAAGAGRELGIHMSMAGGGEDIVVENSTFLTNPGLQSYWTYMNGSNRHGTTFRNNIFTFNGTTQGAFYEPAFRGGSPANVVNCNPLGTNTAILNCYNTHLFTWQNNVLVPGYTDSLNSTGDINAAATFASYTTLVTSPFIPAGSTYAARFAAMKYTSLQNPRLRNDSPYINTATDGAANGADLDQMDDDKGIVKNIRYKLATSTTFTALFHAPDASTACTVGYGTGSDVTMWLRTAADTAASKERIVLVGTPTPLTGNSAYNWQVWCSGAAPSATQKTRTK